MDKIYLLSTIGISLLRNSLPGQDGGKLSAIANLDEVDMDRAALALAHKAGDAARKALASADRNDLKRLSAELNAILSFEDEFETQPVIHHELLVTDTFLGRMAADILSTFFRDNAVDAQPWVITDLRTARGDELRAALSSMVPDLVSRCENASEDGWQVVFNLTGGFKGVNGFLQTAAMLWATETIYLFEGSNELMHIPRLPVGIDTEAVIVGNFDLFRQMACGRAVPVDQARSAGIAGSLLFESDGKAVLSEWGRLIFEKARTQISRTDLIDPVHERIRVSGKFRKKVARLAPDRLQLVNRALYRFSRLLEGEADGWLNSLDFHSNSSLKPPSTHQIDAWSDQDASRICMHEEDGIWLIDSLVPHD